MKPLNVADYRALARKRLPRGVFEYIDRGTEDEVGLRRIRSVLDEITLTQTVLNDIKHCDTGTVVFDTPMRMPVIISPTASAGLAWYDGEVQLARAARASGIPFCVATQSITTIEAIASRAEVPTSGFNFTSSRIGTCLASSWSGPGLRGQARFL